MDETSPTRSGLACASLLASVASLGFIALPFLLAYLRDEYYVSSLVFNIVMGLLEWAALFLMVACPVCGIVLGVWALKRIVRLGQPGAAVAKAGIAIGAALLIVEAAAVVALGLSGRF